MLNRQRVILYILQKAGGLATRIQVMKWAFLLAQETSSRGGPAFYDFVPYKYGPYSFRLHQELLNFVKTGLVDESDARSWRLTSKNGVNSRPPRECQDVALILLRYGDLALNQLLEMVYSRYPWFSVNCENPRNRISNRPSATPAVYTIGYQGSSIDAFLDTLLKSGIRVLADVRHNPTSRSFGFHRGTLSRLCSTVGIEYRGFPELGIPSMERTQLISGKDYASLFSHYRSRILTKEIRPLESVAGAMQSEPTALVCMESEPAYCHRSQLAALIARMTELPVIHLRCKQ